ncbi:MAG: hypothetical protein LBF08_06065 [Dysgonamonadaceae bacterium]|jgi:hypothetical protein|nr:hypothetical protein [Dysgonamonadaceae bacterium]
MRKVPGIRYIKDKEKKYARYVRIDLKRHGENIVLKYFLDVVKEAALNGTQIDWDAERVKFDEKYGE